MMNISYTPKASFNLVKSHNPTHWKPALEPYLIGIMRIKKIKQCGFIEATKFYCRIVTTHADIINVLAAYTYIMEQKDKYIEVCSQLNQYRKQLYALDTAKGYSQKDKNDLRTHYQQKIETLIGEKAQLLAHNEHFKDFEVTCQITIPKPKNPKSWT